MGRFLSRFAESIDVAALIAGFSVAGTATAQPAGPAIEAIKEIHGKSER